MSDILSHRVHLRKLAVLGVPLMGSHIATVAMGMTDALMLGWYDVAALAAVTLSFSMFFVLSIMGSGFAFAVMPMVATALGRDDLTQARRITRMGIWVSTIYGVIVMPPLIWSEPILLALGQDPEIAALAQQYLRVVAFAMVPGLLVTVLKSHLSAVERAQAILWITVLAAIVNAIVNYIFIFGNFGAPELGVVGAGLATMSLTLVSLVATVLYAHSALPEHRLFQRLWRPDREAFAEVFKVGWPIGLTNLAESGLFAASGLMMGWLGTNVLAAHGIAIQLASITFVLHLGLSQAATVRAGNALGRDDRHGLGRGAYVAVVASVLIALVTVAIFLAVPEFLLGLFLDPSDPSKPEIVAIGVGLLVVAALFQLADGGQVMALGLLRGLQDTKTPMIIAALSYWALGMPAAYVFGFVFDWGGPGVWLGLTLGLTSAAGLMMWRFWRVILPRM